MTLLANQRGGGVLKSTGVKCHLAHFAGDLSVAVPATDAETLLRNAGYSVSEVSEMFNQRSLLVTAHSVYKMLPIKSGCVDNAEIEKLL